MCQCHMSHIYFCFFFVCALFHPPPHTLQYGKLNFIHESLRHISWFFLFLLRLFISSWNTLFLPSFSHCFSFSIQTSPHSIHIWQRQRCIRVRTKTKTSAIHNTGLQTKWHISTVFRSKQMAFWFVLPSIFNHYRNHFSLARLLHLSCNQAKQTK